VIYVIYLGDLLDRIGIGRAHLIWFILLDQAVFAVSDTLMGYAADKIERLIGRLGPRIIAVNAVSCLAFVALPFLPEVVGDKLSPVLFTALLVIWIATSSVLRAPPLVLLTKHAARPATPRLAALSLLGLALAGALAPYLGLALTGIDPAVPFVVAAASLALATLGLSRIERITRELPEPERQAATPTVTARGPAVALLLLAVLVVAFGFQIHVFLNSKPLYLEFVSKEQLVWVLPLFWVGFKLLVLPFAAAARRYGPTPILALGALIGGLALLLAAEADSLAMLIAAQMLAGGAWGVVFTTGVGTAVNLGTTGREGLILGTMFSMISLAALTRAGLVAGGLKTNEALSALLPWAPGPLWLLGGLILLGLAYITRGTNP
jgi:MFS family permease